MNNKILFGVVLSFLLILSSVMAFGVSSPYWETNPLIMAAGETKIINLNLQNMVGDEDVNVQLTIVNGTEIATLSKYNYVIKSKEMLDVPLKINVPRSAKQGQTYNVGVQVINTPLESEGQMVTLGTGSLTSFNVIVSGKKENISLYIGIGILIILLILILSTKNKSKKTFKKSKKKISSKK